MHTKLLIKYVHYLALVLTRHQDLQLTNVPLLLRFLADARDVTLPRRSLHGLVTVHKVHEVSGERRVDASRWLH